MDREREMRVISYMGVAVFAGGIGRYYRGRAFSQGRVRTWKGRWKDPEEFQPTNLPSKSTIHIETEGMSRSIPR
jgi:hypothetical protein